VAVGDNANDVGYVDHGKLRASKAEHARAREPSDGSETFLDFCDRDASSSQLSRRAIAASVSMR